MRENQTKGHVKCMVVHKISTLELETKIIIFFPEKREKKNVAKKTRVKFRERDSILYKMTKLDKIKRI